ncbi:MAG: hypothetical protein ACOYOO_12145 [Saprospiraceae bacterium]
MPAFAFAQIFIGAGIPDSSALLELKSTEKGFLLPRITDIQRDSIALPATGLMIFNVSKKCVEINYGRPEAPYWSCLAFAPEEELRCGAYIAPEVWQEFMCYNLGAAYTGQDSARLLSPSWEINGGYWQWGRKAMAAPGPTGPGQQQANSGEIAGWIGEEWAADTAWTGESKTENDPCPEGYRVPALEIWQALLDNNPLTYIGSTWSEVGATNYENGIKLGEKLFLPAAGFRSFDGGYLVQRGIMGSYWSSQAYIEYIDAYFFYFDNFSASTSNFLVRTDGRSVRCAKIESGVEVFPPTVITGLTGPTGTINATAAVVAGEVLQTGGASVTARGFVWSENPSPVVSSASKTINGEGTGFYEGVLDSLEPGKTYYYRAYATNSAGTGYGNELTFMTPVLVPGVTTIPVSAILEGSAVSGGTITSTGGAVVLSRGVVWDTASSPTIALLTKTTDSLSGASFQSQISGLSPGTLYYVRAFATNQAGTGYGAARSFQTATALPTVSTSVVAAITGTSAVTGGAVLSTGGATVSERGVVWSLSPGPTVTLSTKTVDGSGPGSFTSMPDGLSPGRTYYLRAYATNSKGTAYGQEILFSTPVMAPSLSTDVTGPVTYTIPITGQQITEYRSASSGGTVSSNGGSTPYARGVVWGTQSGPTTALATKTNEGAGDGKFVSVIRNLRQSTTYYIRAYATNSAGTGYGNEVIYTTPNYCGAYVAPDVWKTFMCYNLGAADTLGDPFVPGWEIVGGYWQWGRKNMAAPGPAGSSSALANAGLIAGWNTTAAANGAWSNGSKSLPIHVLKVFGSQQMPSGGVC